MAVQGTASIELTHSIFLTLSGGSRPEYEKDAGGKIHCGSICITILLCVWRWKPMMRSEGWELQRKVVWQLPFPSGHKEFTYQKELSSLAGEVAISPSLGLWTCKERKLLLALFSSWIAMRSKGNNVYKSMCKLMGMTKRKHYTLE